jgi:hypothetical protein
VEDQQENPTDPLTIKRCVNKPLCRSLFLRFSLPPSSSPSLSLSLPPLSLSLPPTSISRIRAQLLPAFLLLPLRVNGRIRLQRALLLNIFSCIQVAFNRRPLRCFYDKYSLSMLSRGCPVIRGRAADGLASSRCKCAQ